MRIKKIAQLWCVGSLENEVICCYSLF
ncbi:hypothetical protein CY0110_15812 [Crocosphaera chwakensis CCY0110]|uniref:Uncharacterized protein n=1 Tax=Crocosphaera chwakensis CCY0110 TaxID=391612 RepID=A3IHJ4_9CHRO|nr:hypothetical protein CY0110_15812 [Crocosphaera chwakensis CCY0110]